MNVMQRLDEILAEVRALRADVASLKPGADNRLLDTDAAAELMGINPTALRRRVQRGHVPGVVRQGRRILFNRLALLAGEPTKRRR